MYTVPCSVSLNMTILFVLLGKDVQYVEVYMYIYIMSSFTRVMFWTDWGDAPYIGRASELGKFIDFILFTWI